MDIERETLVEAGVAGLGVLAFIAAVVLVGSQFGSHENVVRSGQEMVSTQLADAGAFAIIAVMGAFIVLMGALGLWLTARQES